MHYGQGNFNNLSHKYLMHKPTEKDLVNSIGVNKFKPRERLVYTPFIPATFDLRASTSEGFFRKNLATSEGNRNM